MRQVFRTADVIAILKDAANEWRRSGNEVCQLDSIVGDGDMGVTVELASKALVDYLTSPGEDDIGKLLMKCGMQINKASPSTFGTLLASAFLEAGKAVLGRREIEFKDLPLVGKSAIAGIKKWGRAEVGDKTMLDALVPAVDAFQQTLDKGATDNLVVEEALKAAKAGAEATVKMKAKFSRASYRQDGGLGVQDAGATAMHYLIEALGRCIISRT